MNAPTARSADQPATASEPSPPTQEFAAVAADSAGPGLPAAGSPAAGTPATGNPPAGTPATSNPAAGSPASGGPPVGTFAANTLVAGAPAAGAEQPAGTELPPPESRPPGFRERARMRRRVRFLRKARELAYRDLGGLVFEMQRSRQRNDELVAAKLGVLAAYDTELRTLEAALGERQPLTVLREAGIAACPRCAAIHGSDDRFCPMCGMPFGRPQASPVAATPQLAASPPAATTAASIAAAASVPPGQLPRSAAAAPGTPTPGPTPPTVAPAIPAATPVRAPAAQDDRPTEIVRPPDDAK